MTEVRWDYLCKHHNKLELWSSWLFADQYWLPSMKKNGHGPAASMQAVMQGWGDSVSAF
jgi:hypothetical protein